MVSSLAIIKLFLRLDLRKDGDIIVDLCQIILMRKVLLVFIINELFNSLKY